MAKKTNELSKLWKLILRDILMLFQCSQLHSVSEVEWNIVEPVRDPFDAFFMYF
jgi:hypothetical protein